MSSRRTPTSQAAHFKRIRRSAALTALTWDVLFALACGPLNHNRTARTFDPTPAFPALVELTQRWLHPTAFHVHFGVLLALYGLVLQKVIAERVDATFARLQRVGSLLALTTLYSAATRLTLDTGLEDGNLSRRPTPVSGCWSRLRLAPFESRGDRT